MRTQTSILALLVLVLAAGGCSRCGSKPAATAPTTPSATPASRPAGLALTLPGAATLPAIPTEPLTAADTATCDVAESLLKRLACIASLAQTKRDPRFCDRVGELAKQAGPQEPEVVRSGAATNSCYRSIALMRDDPALCNRIGDPSMAGSCLTYFAMKRHDPKVCELGTGEAIPTCFLNEAARTRDPSLCQRTGKFQTDCEKRLGAATP